VASHPEAQLCSTLRYLAGHTRYRSVPTLTSRKYGGRRAERVIRNTVLATVARDRRDPLETIAA
jgi:hypothetical protein